MMTSPASPASGRTVYCTVAAANYLPQVLALSESVERHAPGIELHVLVVDRERVDLPDLPALPNLTTVHGLEFVLSSTRERHALAAIYDVVELSTAVKPRYFELLLEEAERVIYLDPDMWLTSPITELDALIDRHGIVLTPHFLEPILPDARLSDGSPLNISEVHSLNVGVHNLGFCAVGRDGLPFLRWWWAHLQRECLIYPLLGMFVDQKWTDVGAVLFSAHSLRHPGYNIANWNLQERRFHWSPEGELLLDASELPVRVLHFSGFDPDRPRAISVRQNVSLVGSGLAFPAFDEVSDSYAAVLAGAQAALRALPDYGWSNDSTGRPLSRRLRRTYRRELLSGRHLPSPFDPDDAAAFARWRRRAVPRELAGASMDFAIACKYAFPDTFARIKNASPGIFGVVRRSLLDAGRIRR